MVYITLWLCWFKCASFFKFIVGINFHEHLNTTVNRSVEIYDCDTNLKRYEKLCSLIYSCCNRGTQIYGYKIVLKIRKILSKSKIRNAKDLAFILYSKYRKNLAIKIITSER